MTDLLDVRGLSVRVRGGPVVVENVSFSLGRGRRLGIVGGSGSGKSVTIHAIAGLLAEELTPSGSVRLEGVELLDLPEVARARLRGRRIATVFQEPMTALDPTRRIGDQVRAALDIHGLGPARERQAKALDLLAAVGLPPSRFSPRLFPHELSGGQRQRVLLAAALSAEPDLLLADEPTTALDLVTQRQILRLLDDLVEQRGVALVLVSHDLAVIARMCSHVLVMDQGRIVETGPVDDVLAKRAGPSRNAMATHVQHQGADAADLLSVRNVSRRYRLPDGSWRRAVEEVDLRIAQGEALGLVGASGSGKSTLARLVSGLDRPESGSIRLGGHDPARRSEVRHSVQMVFQDPFDSLNPRWKVGRIVGEPLELDRLQRAEHAHKVADALEEVDLPADAAARYPHAFSGGQRQRIAIARALVARPRLVVLDEPLSALDVATQDQVLDLLARLRTRHGLAYLMVSHDLTVVRRICSRVLVLADGRVVEEGAVDTVLREPRSTAGRALVDAVLAPTVAPQQSPD